MLIPATTAPNERTYSSLNFVKNDLRSTTLEDRRFCRFSRSRSGSGDNEHSSLS